MGSLLDQTELMESYAWLLEATGPMGGNGTEGRSSGGTNGTDGLVGVKETCDMDLPAFYSLDKNKALTTSTSATLIGAGVSKEAQEPLSQPVFLSSAAILLPYLKTQVRKPGTEQSAWLDIKKFNARVNFFVYGAPPRSDKNTNQLWHEEREAATFRVELVELIEFREECGIIERLLKKKCRKFQVRIPNNQTRTVNISITTMAVFSFCRTQKPLGWRSNLLQEMRTGIGSLEAVRRGMSVRIISSPFGLVSPVVFASSISDGIISTVLPHSSQRRGQAKIYLTDARCLPGSEGAPVFVGRWPWKQHGLAKQRGHQLFGILLPSFDSFDFFELSKDFYLAPVLPIDRVLSRIDDTLNHGDRMQRTLAPEQHLRTKVNKFEVGVVLLQVSTSWGTGIVIDAQHGYILTCAHLLKPFFLKHSGSTETTARLKPGTLILASASYFRHQQTHLLERSVKKVPCQLIYCSQGPIDIAVLRMNAGADGSKAQFGEVSLPQQVNRALEETDSLESFLRLSRWLRCPQRDRAMAMADKGDLCYSSGFAVFEPVTETGVVVSRGSISKIVHLPFEPQPRTQQCLTALESRVVTFFLAELLNPCMYQTSAFVYRGHSGGPLLDENVHFIGVLTSNSKSANKQGKTSRTKIIPNLNFVIPLNVLLPLIYCSKKACFETNYRLVKAIYDEDVDNTRILERLWALQVTQTSFPSQSKL